VCETEGETIVVNPATMNILQQPFIQVALPIMVALTLAAWLQNKRFDDVNRRIDEVIRRLDRIETKLDNHNERIARLEERTSLVR
jgi:GTPase